MPAAKLTSKGQLVIPKAIRDHMGLRSGDRLDFLIQESGDVLIRPATSDVRGLRGALARRGRKPVSLAKMNEAIRRRASVRT
jgi:antitoxin PrlF